MLLPSTWWAAVATPQRNPSGNLATGVCRLRTAQQAFVFGVIRHGDGLVDQEHGDSILDAVAATQPRVVEQLIVADQQEWPTVLGADQDVQQLFVEHGKRSAGRHVDR